MNDHTECVAAGIAVGLALVAGSFAGQRLGIAAAELTFRAWNASADWLVEKFVVVK